MNTKEISKEKGLAKAMAICAKQEKCISDIRKKLYDWKVNPSYHDEIINQLISEKFIDESRYAVIFVRDKFNFNKWGKIKIDYALRNKQIASNLIEENLQLIDQDEYINTCRQLILSKRKSIKDTELFKVKEKLARFMQSRGFEPDLIFTLLDEILSKKD